MQNKDVYFLLLCNVYFFKRRNNDCVGLFLIVATEQPFHFNLFW